MRLHLDTDLGGDPDDAAALVMLLGWSGVELTGITTTADPDGRRAGYVRLLLSMLDVDVPVAVGAGRSSTTGEPMGMLADHGRYWGHAPLPVASEHQPEEALQLLQHSVEAGATVVAIGPLTNLALLERSSSGALDGVPVVTMGGWLDPFGDGYPTWGPERDWNVQCDTTAARALFETAAELTLVPCAAAVAGSVRTTDLPRLSSSGGVGALLARQMTTYGGDQGHPDLGRHHEALPDDLVSFLWDPVTCAVSLDWAGAEVQSTELTPVQEGRLLRFSRQPGGRRTRVVTSVDGEAFRAAWLEAVAAAQARRP